MEIVISQLFSLVFHNWNINFQFGYFFRPLNNVFYLIFWFFLYFLLARCFGDWFLCHRNSKCVPQQCIIPMRKIILNHIWKVLAYVYILTKVRNCKQNTFLLISEQKSTEKGLDGKDFHKSELSKKKVFNWKFKLIRLLIFKIIGWWNLIIYDILWLW